MGIAERKEECDNETFTMLWAHAVLEAALEVAPQTGAPAAEGGLWSHRSETTVGHHMRLLAEQGKHSRLEEA